MTSITHTGFFGTGDHAFALTDPMVAELERLTAPIGTLYQRAVAMQFSASDLVEIIRLGLIGAGMAPQAAMNLVKTYAVDRPLSETYPLALDILDARWNGSTAQATGDTAE